MKSRIWAAALLLVLAGCSSENRELSQAMEFRDRLLSAEGCSFQAEVTADYGDSLHQFSLDCRGDGTGQLHFTVTAPDTISGIEGTVSETGGNILFEDKALYFPLLTDDQLNPASAPWILLRSLRGGCITAVCTEEELLRITVDDSYDDDALHLDVWLQEGKPVRSDILYDGKRILSLKIENFDVS